MTDKQIQAAYDLISKRINTVNEEYLKLVAEQIKEIGTLNPSSLNRLVQMRRYNANVRTIKKTLADALNLTVKDVQTLLEEAAKQEYASKEYIALIQGNQAFGLEYNPVLQQYIRSIAAQTADAFENYSNTTNVDNQYKEIVSDAIDCNETFAKQIGLYEVAQLEDGKSDADLSKTFELLGGHYESRRYLTLTKSKEFKVENQDKEIWSSLINFFLPMWKQHIFYLNQEENRLLAELRDAMLPELMSGKLIVQ